MRAGLSQNLYVLGLTLCIFSFLNFNLYAQNNKNEFLNFKPYSFSTEISADGRIGLSDTDPGFGVDQIRWNNTLNFKNNFSLSAQFKFNIGTDAYWYEFDKRKVTLAQLYLQYSKPFFLFNKQTSINARAGKLEYYPSYSDARQVINNLEQYISPPEYYGASLNANINLIDKFSLSGFLSANSGDLKSGSYKGGITNLYLQLSPRITKDFGLMVTAGYIEGTKYAVNEATISYNHTFKEIVNFSAKAGKLIGFDDTPYGLQLALEGNFKYVMLGVSFEKEE